MNIKYNYLLNKKKGNIILLIFIINMCIIFTFGCYLEEYEGMISSFISGIYTTPVLKEWNLDLHFLLLPIYSKIAFYFPDVNVYAFILLTYNLVILTMLGYLILTYLRYLLNNNLYIYILFLILYLIIAIDSILNLNSTRIVFTSMILIFGYVQLYRLKNLRMNIFTCFFISIALLFLCLIRMDAVLLSSIIYIFLLILFKQFYKLSLVPLIISLSSLVSYSICIIPKLSEARQSFYLKELDIFDRSNFKTDNIPKLANLDIDAIKNHYIFDKEHFTLHFYDMIAKESGKGIFNIFNGIRLDSMKNTILSSLPYFLSSIILILFFLLLFFIGIKGNASKKSFILKSAFCMLMPLFICLYVITPSRFLIPYYVTLSSIYIFMYLKKRESPIKIIFISSFILILIILKAGKDKHNYETLQTQYLTNISSLQKLTANEKIRNPIVINNIERIYFFPVSIFSYTPKLNAVFLNFYYFNSFNCYLDRWNKICNCNPLSLKEKVDYISKNGNTIIIDNNSFLFMKKYFLTKYNINLQKSVLGNFNEELLIMKIIVIK